MDSVLASALIVEGGIAARAGRVVPAAGRHDGCGDRGCREQEGEGALVRPVGTEADARHARRRRRNGLCKRRRRRRQPGQRWRPRRRRRQSCAPSQAPPPPSSPSHPPNRNHLKRTPARSAAAAAASERSLASRAWRRSARHEPCPLAVPLARLSPPSSRPLRRSLRISAASACL
eukprot:363348-Chlamydomonas_euryale.AAC.6